MSLSQLKDLSHYRDQLFICLFAVDMVSDLPMCDYMRIHNSPSQNCQRCRPLTKDSIASPALLSPVVGASVLRPRPPICMVSTRGPQSILWECLA